MHRGMALLAVFFTLAVLLALLVGVVRARTRRGEAAGITGAEAVAAVRRRSEAARAAAAGGGTAVAVTERPVQDDAQVVAHIALAPPEPPPAPKPEPSPVAVAQVSPRAFVPAQRSPERLPRSAQARLRELEDLRDRGVISEEEYVGRCLAVRQTVV